MKTAIILTGGLGTRLSPITTTLNKGLVPAYGEPILKKILLQVDLLGIERCLILTGHLAWQVAVFSERIATDLRCKIQVVSTPPDFSPADRLLHSAEFWKASSEIILVYCDNLIRNEDLIKLFDDSQQLKVLVQRRKPGNVYKEESGNLRYSVNRSNSNPYVELGFWRLSPTIFLNSLLERKQLPEALEYYSSAQKIRALEVENYFSASNLARYVTQRAKSRVTIFLDRDGVLVRSVGKGEYLGGSNQIEIIMENVNFFRSLSSRFNVDYVVVTNQAGIERGIVTAQDVELVNQKLALEMLLNNVPIIAFYVCPHHWDSNCGCRKPKPGLINKAIRELSIEPSRTLLIGDRVSDIQAGKNAGVKSYLITEQMGETERHEIYEEIIGFVEDL